ncbi:hypothetical protein ACS0TY_019355 [Phlomoides rotata]
MSSQDDDGMSMDKGSESHDDDLMKPNISYSREFLLSIGDLESCRKLPSGFNESMISEFEDALLRVPDRPRIPGSFSQHGFKRSDFSSSPPTRGDTGNSRGIYGKWESRCSARSERESDSQSERDSESGRRFSQSRRSWQTPEHDGLLGSGSFPRPSGYAAGMSASKVRANEQNQLSRSNEPYHPPRPYKAPHSRRDTDSINDETFGSVESTSEDRAEQERRRRASFEIMRKEQQKTLQEKHTGGGLLNLCEGLEDNREEKGLLVRNNEMEVSAVPSILSNDLEKSSFASHAPASRLPAPPGFKTNPLDKKIVNKSLVHPYQSEVGKLDADTNLLQNGNKVLESQPSQESSLVDGQPAEKIPHHLLFNKGESMNAHVSLDVPIKRSVIEDQLLRVSSHLDSHGSLDDPKAAKLNAKLLDEKNVHDSSGSHSTSILEKIFCSAISMNDGHSGSPKLHDSKPDDTWSPKSVQSSKFVQWFSEEEPKAVEDFTSARQNDLLSLIVSGDKDKNQVSDSEAAKLFPHDFSYKTSKQSTQVKLGMPPSADGLSGQASINNKEDAAPTVLTCEDLEQTMLSEYGSKPTNVEPALKNWSAGGGSTAQPSAHVDNNASFHLLSMLHKSTDQSNSSGQLVFREHGRSTVVNEPQGEENAKIVPNLGNSLTLEALFGSAFMQELQSVEAPVSVQRGSSGSSQVDATESHGLPFPVSDNDISSPTVGKNGPPRQAHDYRLSSDHIQHTKLREAENWQFDGPPIGISSPKHHAEALNKRGGFEFQLPEEENLISVGDAQEPRVLRFMPPGNSMNNVLNTSSSPPINIMEKLAAFGAAVKDKHGIEGSENVPFTRDSYQHMQPDISYHNLQLQQQSSPHFQSPHMSQGRPSYHHLESDHAHMNSQLKFLGPDPIFNRDSPASHPFPINVIRPSLHHPNARISGFEVPSQHPGMHHGNHPHFARGGPVPHHSNPSAGFAPEMNQMQGFPFGPPRQPSIGSGGVPMPGGNPPEALQRLLEMEVRAKSKQNYPFAPPAVHSQGMFGHELDMGFRYR